jgi:hypothetical protein
MAGERAELLVTLSLLGAKYYVFWKLHGGNVSVSPDPVSLTDLTDSPLHFTLGVEYEDNHWDAGKHMKTVAERGVVGVVHPPVAFPDEYAADHVVQWKSSHRKGSNWHMNTSVSHHHDFAGAAYYIPQWLYEGGRAPIKEDTL